MKNITIKLEEHDDMRIRNDARDIGLNLSEYVRLLLRRGQDDNRLAVEIAELRKAIFIANANSGFARVVLAEIVQSGKLVNKDRVLESWRQFKEKESSK